MTNYSSYGQTVEKKSNWQRNCMCAIDMQIKICDSLIQAVTYFLENIQHTKSKLVKKKLVERLKEEARKTLQDLKDFYQQMNCLKKKISELQEIDNKISKSIVDELFENQEKLLHTLGKESQKISNQKSFIRNTSLNRSLLRRITVTQRTASRNFKLFEAQLALDMEIGNVNRMINLLLKDCANLSVLLQEARLMREKASKFAKCTKETKKSAESYNKGVTYIMISVGCFLFLLLFIKYKLSSTQHRISVEIMNGSNSVVKVI